MSTKKKTEEQVEEVPTEIGPAIPEQETPMEEIEARIEEPTENSASEETPAVAEESDEEEFHGYSAPITTGPTDNH